jgi:hypothetical protein
VTTDRHLNHRIVLASRPRDGHENCFRRESARCPRLESGNALIRVLLLPLLQRYEPAERKRSLSRRLRNGEVVRCIGVGQLLVSNTTRSSPADLVMDFSTCDVTGWTLKPLRERRRNATQTAPASKSSAAWRPIEPHHDSEVVSGQPACRNRLRPAVVSAFGPKTSLQGTDPGSDYI